MNHDKEAMGEQPIFTCLAHVFHIDPKTKRTWITASSKAVSVSFFYDSSRQLYRIISVEGQKAVINSTITPSMSFTQTSQKFGQWSDIRANTVYGLGFSSENELTKFVEKFHEVKEATKNVLAKSSTTNGSTAVTPVTSANTSPVTGRAASVFNNDNVMNNEIEPPQSMLQSTNIQNPESPSHKLPSVNNIDMKQFPVINSNNLSTATTNERALLVGDSSGEAGGVGGCGGRVSNSNLSHSEQQLKYENERLKTALAQSCANAKNWEIELATLKSNNTRLTSALKESTANVDEWKRQLHTYKEDNIRLKREMDMLKAGGASSSGTDNSNDIINEEMRRETILLKTRIQTLEKELLNQEIELKAVNKNLKDRNNDQTIRQITDLSDKFAKQLCEMSNVHKDLEKVLQLHKST